MKLRKGEGEYPEGDGAAAGRRRKNCWRERKIVVDILKLLIIIGASMIEARMSRVRLPTGLQEPGRGKGASAEVSPSPLREPEPGRGENIPRTVTSPEVERCRGFNRFVWSV